MQDMHKTAGLWALHKGDAFRQPDHLLNVMSVAGQFGVFRHRQDRHRITAEFDLIAGIHQEIGLAAVRQGKGFNQFAAEIL